MEEDFGGCIGGLIALVIGVFLLLKLFEFTLTGLYWALSSLSYWLISGLEWLFSGSLMPERPEVMWAIWGGALGGALGFYPVAPVYGLKRHRATLIWSVIAAMVAVAWFV